MLICHFGVSSGKLAFSRTRVLLYVCSCRLTENSFPWKPTHWKSCRRTSMISYWHFPMTYRTSCSKLAQRDCYWAFLCRKQKVNIVSQKTVAYQLQNAARHCILTLQVDCPSSIARYTIFTVFFHWNTNATKGIPVSNNVGNKCS